MFIDLHYFNSNFVKYSLLYCALGNKTIISTKKKLAFLCTLWKSKMYSNLCNSYVYVNPKYVRPILCSTMFQREKNYSLKCYYI